MKTRRNTAAFTLVELMVALVVAMIVTGAVYVLYGNYVKAFIGQDRVIETQQAARIALDTLTQDLIRAGYKVSSTDPAVTLAASQVVELRLYNDQAASYERIRYYISGGQLRRDVYRPDTATTPDVSLSGVLAENLEAGPDGSPALRFVYYTQGAFETNAASPAALNVTVPKDADNPANDTGAVSDPTNLRDVRQVEVTLTVRSSQQDPVTGRYVYRTLRADVKPRNAGLMSTIKDNTPPATPTGFASVDRGDCGYLYLSWNENSEPDLAGYVVYYGTIPGVYDGSVNVGKGIAHSAASPYRLSGVLEGTTYYLAIAAFDYSGNASAPSSTLVGTSGTADTTPNVSNPDSAPVAFTGTPGMNQVVLSWTALGEPDVVGYNLYRKPSPFTSSDFNAIRTNNLAGAGIRLVADWTMFSPTLATGVSQTASGFSYLDRTDDLKGCVDYYYAVTAVKGCNHPITTYADALFAQTGPDRPSDATPPAEPKLVAHPSYLRNYLEVTTPASVDFSHTRVAYRTDGTYPTFSVDGGGNFATTGTPVECHPTSYGEGSFTEQGSVPTFLHRGIPCDTAYHLNPAVTYYYTAVAVDTCKNLSTPTFGQSQVAATQCADETEGPGVGNPPKVAGPNGNTRPTVGSLDTSEAPLAWTPVDDSFGAIRDLAGYYVARKAGNSAATTPFPVLSDIWNDPKAPGLRLSPNVAYTGLVEGQVNRVRILGVDCETVTKDDVMHTFITSRYPSGEFNLKASDTLIFYPGRLALDSTVATKALNKTYNVVEFQAKNSINAAATGASSAEKIDFKGLTFDWTTPNGGDGVDRLLKSVTVRNGTTTFKRTFASPGLKSPATFDGADDGGTRIGFRGATNAVVQLEFYNSGTLGPSKADMRRLRVDVTATYVPVTRLNSDTATPFVFGGTQEATVCFSVPASRGPDIANVRHRIADTTDPFTAASTTLGAFGAAVTFDSFNVEVAADVTDNSGRGIDRVRIYYAVTPKTVTAAPTFDAAFPFPVGLAYTPVVVCDSDGATAAPGCSGTAVYSGKVPAQDDQRVWFLILVEDKAGNYSVSPPQETADSNVTYVYDQNPGGLL